MKRSLKFTALITLGMMLLLILVQCFMPQKTDYDLTIQGIDFIQLEKPQEGAEIAIFETSLGEFRAVLYRDQAPKTVEHFTSLASSGYYDGKFVYRVEDGVYFVAGTNNRFGKIIEEKHSDESSTDEGMTFDEEVYAEETKVLERETSPDLWPFKGALISIGKDFDSNGGTFFCGVNSIDFTDKVKKSLYDTKDVNSQLVDKFIEVGGVPSYSQLYTVFAQVYDGLDVYEQITRLPIEDGNSNKYPKEPFKIISVKISTYSE